MNEHVNDKAIDSAANTHHISAAILKGSQLITSGAEIAKEILINILQYYDTFINPLALFKIAISKNVFSFLMFCFWMTSHTYKIEYF